MGQQDVFNFLQQNPDKWFTVREICKVMGLSHSSVGRALKVLRIRKDVEFKPIPRLGKGYMYRYDG